MALVEPESRVDDCRAAADKGAAERRPSPLLSNNPFRNRIGSSATSPAPDPPASTRPVSTNPFLDASEVDATATVNEPTMTEPAVTAAAKTGLDETREHFDQLTVSERPHTSRGAPAAALNGAPRRAENASSPRRKESGPPPHHRPSASEEDRRRRQARPARPAGELDIFADPPDPARLRERRPRRNSESSIREKTSKLPGADDDKKRRERREREKRYGKPKMDNRRLDVIDKLDVTSIYGMGLFHHDGPFDACNPHRNRKGARQAPMQAFPKDSRNMAIGGSGPNNSRLNLDQIHGTTQEAHIDYNEAALVDEDASYMNRPQTARLASFNPTERVEPLHGQESAGLGTSTFLEGAPASRAAIQRRESENEAAQLNGTGLSRKKSIVQKIRAVRGKTDGGSMTSPEPMATPTSPPAKQTEPSTNPFFKDYDKEYDRKGAAIAFAEEQQKKTTGRMRAPSSPRRGLGLERKMTQESPGEGEAKASGGGGGLLSRVKSLKGGRSKNRADRREPSN